MQGPACSFHSASTARTAAVEPEGLRPAGRRTRAVVAAALAVATACGPAGDTRDPAQAAGSAAAGPPRLAVRDARVRLLPDSGAVYLTIHNSGETGDRLTAVETPAAAAAETHETVMEGGMMRMVPRPEGFEIPPASTLVLEPGGRHVMLVAPQLADQSPETVELTLRFERSEPLSILASVESSLP